MNKKLLCIIFVFLALGTCVAVYYYYKQPIFNEKKLNYYYTFSLSSDYVKNYGFFYPITVQLRFVNDIGNSTVSAEYSHNEKNWFSLNKKTSTDFFNGENCFRVDNSSIYSTYVYVSVAFAGHTNVSVALFLGDENVPVTYEKVTQYYDNRKCVVTSSIDDFNDVDMQSCIDEIETFRKYKLWSSIGIQTGSINKDNWNKVQQEVNQGYVEVCSHSRTHPDIPYSDYNSEIVGSKQDILSNLTLPYGQYVYVWIEPNNHGDQTQRAICGQAKYIVDRTLASLYNYYYAPWKTDTQMFDAVGGTMRIGSDGTTNEFLLNQKFDDIYQNGGIYHLMAHPVLVDWNASYVLNHLNHIANRLDVWYAPLGACVYLYHLASLFLTYESSW